MRILLLADIHANLPALKAVLAAGKSLGYDELWCLGDIVGYGPHPNECTRLIRQEASRCIAGNLDAKVVSDKKIQAIVDHSREAYKVFIFAWTHQALAEDVREYLKALPGQLRVEIEKQRFLLVHGSPAGMDDGMTPYTSRARFGEIAAASQADVILAGHTHTAFSHEAAGVVFINPGSVGRPFGGDNRADFALLKVGAQGVQVDLHQVVYDIEPVLSEMRAQEFPPVLIKAFQNACSPADVLPENMTGDLADEARQLGEKFGVDRNHALAVTTLALKIFDQTRDLHLAQPRERALLQAAALLHDVGMTRDTDDHHKASRDIILQDRRLPLSDRERVVVALMARYHRRSLPKPDHKYFKYLPDYHKVMVERLGGILRMADGLDRRHRALVRDVTVDITVDEVVLTLSAAESLGAEVEYGRLKSDLFERAFGKRVSVGVRGED